MTVPHAKQLILDYLLFHDYALEDARQSLVTADIDIDDSTQRIKVTYDNGKSDLFRMNGNQLALV